jgi:predicted MPP superfamily phosphohydrolase
MGGAAALRACCGGESRWGRLKWAAAGWCVFFGLLYLATGGASRTLAGVAAVPAVPAAFALIVGWSWDRAVLPFVEGWPRLRRPAMALVAWYWVGWFVVIPIDAGTISGAPPVSKGRSEPSGFTQFRYNWMGSLAIMAGLLWMLAVGEWLVLRLGPRLLAGPGRWRDREPVDACGGCLGGERTAEWKLNVRRAVATALLVLYALLTALAVSAGHGTPRVVRVTLPMAGLPPCLSGYRVAMLSDVHGGPVVGLTDVGEYVDALNALKPDAEVLVGDMADGPPAERGDELAPVSRLNAPDGSFFVTGNHEYGHGSTGNDWLRWMESHGVVPLNNTGLALPRPPQSRASSRFPDCTAADTFDLLGVVDRKACRGRDDQSLCERGRVQLAVAAAKAKLQPAQAAQLGTAARASLLLAHQPLDADSAAEAGLTAQVAGHTHGGQIW